MEELLERSAELGQLDAAVEAASTGQGCLIFVVGEAGIGKSSVVRAFVRGVGGGPVSCWVCVTTC